MRMSLHFLRKTNVIFIYLACLCTITGHAIKTSTVCTSSPIPPVVYLECNDTERIHVQSIAYKLTTRDCEELPASQQCQLLRETRRAAYSTACEGESPQSCQTLTQKGRDTFSTSCNGLSSCWETINDFWMVEKCGQSSISVTVSYECISDYLIDVCEDISFTPQNKNIFLSSPAFINPARRGPQHACFCVVEGDELSVELLELYLIQREEQRANLTMKSDTEVWTSQGHKAVAYNDVQMESVKTLNLTFDSRQLFGQVFWIRIKGGSLKKVDCNKGSSTTISTEIVVETTVAQPRAESIRGSSDNDTSVVPLVILIVVLILTVLVLLLLIYIVCRFREKHPSNYSIHRLEDSGVSYIKFDYISNTSSLPDECADNKTYYDLPSLAGTDASDTVNSGRPIESLGRIEEQHAQRRSLPSRLVAERERSAPHGGGNPHVDILQEDVDVEEMQRLRVVRYPDRYLLQRD